MVHGVKHSLSRKKLLKSGILVILLKNPFKLGERHGCLISQGCYNGILSGRGKMIKALLLFEIFHFEWIKEEAKEMN